jgi:hypothetical protein
MNHLVFLDARAGELEKILSGVKTMLIKQSDPTQSSSYPVNPSDNLYFLKGHEDCVVRVKATVVRVLFLSRHGEGGQLADDLAHALKEMQPRLHLTESQYNYWTAKPQALLVEFGSAHKIDPFQVDSNKIPDRSDWIAFEEFRMMMG